MAIKLGEFLHNLIKKAGQNPDAEPIKNFFLFPSLAEIDVPDELVTALDNNLLSVADARNNHPDIKKFYDAQTLDQLDKVIASILTEVNDEEVKTSVLNERSTFKKVPILVAKIKELEAKKQAANSKPDKDAIQEQKNAYQKQLDQLTFDLKSVQKEKDKLKEDFDNKLTDIKRDSRIATMLSSYKTIYDDLDPEVKADTINAIMNRELQKHDAEFFFDEKSDLAIRKRDKTNLLGDNHQQIMPQAFIEQILSRHKLLKVTSTDQGQPDDNANGFNALAGAPATATGNGKPQRNPLLKELVKDAQTSLKDNASRPVM